MGQVFWLGIIINICNFKQAKNHFKNLLTYSMK